MRGQPEDDISQYRAILERLHRLEQAQILPTGTIVLWEESTAVPDGWLACDSSSFSSSDYPELAALWGTSTLPPDPGVSSMIAIVLAR